MSDKQQPPKWNITNSAPSGWKKAEELSFQIPTQQNGDNSEDNKLHGDIYNTETENDSEDENTENQPDNTVAAANDSNEKSDKDEVVKETAIMPPKEDKNFEVIKSRNTDYTNVKQSLSFTPAKLILLSFSVLLFAVICGFGVLYLKKASVQKYENNTDSEVNSLSVKEIVTDSDIISNNDTDSEKEQIKSSASSVTSSRNNSLVTSSKKSENKNSKTSSITSSESDFEPYVITVLPNTPIYKEPFYISDVVQVIEEGGKYTIVEERWGSGGTFGRWGKLKSGVGWINLYDATTPYYDDSFDSEDYYSDYDIEYVDTSESADYSDVDESDIDDSDKTELIDTETVDTETIETETFESEGITFEYPTFYSQGDLSVKINSFNTEIEKSSSNNRVTFYFMGELKYDKYGSGRIYYESYDSEDFLISSGSFLNCHISKDVKDFKFRETRIFDANVSYIRIYIVF